MDIIINGANGRMGQMLAEAIQQAGTPDYRIAARVDPSLSLDIDLKTFSDLKQFTGPADVVIDFSSHAATIPLLDYCLERMIPVVIATTGQTEEEFEAIRRASGHIPIFLSANMSLGVALLADLARRAAAVLPNADIEIIERHHNQKLDVPSGTALLLAKNIVLSRPDLRPIVGRHEHGKRSKQELGIHSLRYGSEVGEHEVILSTGKETISLTHRAENRALFAQGALAAAAFIVGKTPKLYDMRDIME